jgi:hypothetical protein
MSQTRRGSGSPDAVPVTWGEGGQFHGAVTISGVNRQTIELLRGAYKETHPFSALIDDARRGHLPGWAAAVPEIVQRIAALFAQERARGENPHVRTRVDSYGATYENLLGGSSLSFTFAEMRLCLREGRKLPPWLDIPEVKSRLGID